MKKVGALFLFSALLISVGCRKKTVENPTTPPKITLNGSSSISMNLGDTYTELGATAKDVDGNSVSVSINSSNLDVDRVGTYQVVYTAKDSYGNTAQKARSVSVNITNNTWIGGWNVSHDVKTSLGQNLIKNTCDVSIFLSIATFDHDGQVVTGTVTGQDVTIDPSRVTINAGAGKYDLYGTGTINNTGDTIIIDYEWDGACTLCFDGSGTATYTKQ